MEPAKNKFIWKKEMLDINYFVFMFVFILLSRLLIYLHKISKIRINQYRH